MNRETGLDIIGSIPWGAHLCHFYQTKEDLIDILVPYFKAGLENNEFCMWVTCEPLKAEEAKSALRKAIDNLDGYIKNGRIEVLDYTQWYAKSGKFDSEEVLQGWVKKHNQAIEMGFDGLRAAGNALWLEKKDWKSFDDYEKTVERVIGKYKMLAICSYSLDKCSASEIIGVVSNHQFAVIRKEKWEIIESPQRKYMEEALKIAEQKFKDIVENTSDWIWEIDKNGTYTYVSPKVKDLLGYEVNEILGKTPFDFMPEEEARKISAIFKEKAAKKEQCIRLENINRHKDGYLVYLETSCVAILDEMGRLTGYRGIDRDITDRKKAEDQLKYYILKLEEQKMSLEQKNLALKEMIEHIERTKNRMKADIAINVDETLMPIVEKLRTKGFSSKHVKLLKHHLKSISSSFGRKIMQRSVKLTSREIEICNMIKGGFVSKDISELLNISSQTVEKHRANIRKKLGLSNKKTNLFSYLLNI